jgi:hypothetical protein
LHICSGTIQQNAVRRKIESATAEDNGLMIHRQEKPKQSHKVNRITINDHSNKDAVNTRDMTASSCFRKLRSTTSHNTQRQREETQKIQTLASAL